MKTSLTKLVGDLKSIDGVEAIYLFGSVTRGKAKPISDIDICVITNEDGNKKRDEILSTASDKIDTSVFWDLPLIIQYRVIKDGKPIFVRNSMFLHKIATSTVNRYLDFKPVIDRRTMRMMAG